MAKTANRDSQNPTLRLGQELVRRRLASLTQIRECVAAQTDLERRGQTVPIGSILVTRGILTLEELKGSLSSLGLLFMACPQCHQEVQVSDYQSQRAYYCSRCSGELVFSSNRPETLDGTISRPPNLPTEDLDEKFIGEEVGGCKILSKIARGGMGTVYLGEQIHLGRRVAVKILAPELARDESFVKRFIQEARAVAELSHPSIIHIIDAGAANGCFYFTMEYIEGENLSKILKQRGPIPLGETLNLMEQVADALCHAHSRGIVHRDIKPDNILVTQAGQVKLADLGLAKRTFDENASAITQAGSILGTPYYMAPEQARDFRLADERSDLYSLGVTIYKVLSGSVPYDGHSPIEVMMKALQGDKIPLDQRDPSIPAEAVALVDRMMHVDPAGRFKSAEICRNAIQSLRRHLAETAR